MIRFLTSNGSLTGSKVVFTPRPSLIERGVKELSFDMLYGHYCQYCNNVVQAVFLTPKKVTLGRHEETRVVNSERDVLHIIPSVESEYTSGYEVEFMSVEGKEMGLERIYMKNHVLRFDKLGRGEDQFEPGERVCPYTGVTSLRKELLIRDTFLMGGMCADELLKDYRLPSWRDFEDLINDDRMHTFAYTTGDAPPMVMAQRDFVKEPGQHWRSRLGKFKKPAAD